MPLKLKKGTMIRQSRFFQFEFPCLIVYRKGDIVMEPMNSRDVLPKNVPGVGWGRVGHVGVGWGGVGVGWGGGGVGWVM